MNTLVHIDAVKISNEFLFSGNYSLRKLIKKTKETKNIIKKLPKATTRAEAKKMAYKTKTEFGIRRAELAIYFCEKNKIKEAEIHITHGCTVYFYNAKNQIIETVITDFLAHEERTIISNRLRLPLIDNSRDS